ncbi:MAG: hypothetical protein B7Z67_09075 [Acidiphilium sp. 21-60-14]|nr:MAG: hypothetical protein B7Z67_09075 [Acidiphilium sp. 21-60-14]OYV89839.1 MAG: hypothetical protein B7Z57_11115 [Acidiphilium sp. 37-60-79]OZB38483.1 MAG: hypothetical protein B7X48_13065 [Acidiphilium sp. 34-60-192]
MGLGPLCDRSARGRGMRGRWLPVTGALGLVGMLAGCVQAPKPLYFWGDYQGVMYQLQAKPGSMDPSEAIAKLTTNIEKAAAKGMLVPPGEHAELGYLQYQAGDQAQAAAQFRLEKQLYPASSGLMDRLLAKMQPRAGANS